LNVSTRTKLKLQLLFCIVVQKRTRKEKTREEEFRKDRTNGEEVMLLRFDQYKCT
jgi:hypothetical protein